MSCVLLVGAISVLLAVLAIYRVGLVPELAAVFVFIGAAGFLIPIDIDCHLLPNLIVLPSFVVILLLLTGASASVSDWARLGGALLGSIAMFVGYLLLAMISPRSMGMGDVKLAAVIGLLLGYFGADVWLTGLCAAFVLGGVMTLLLLVTRRANMSTQVPFGPAMLLGALAAIMFV